MVDVDLFNDCVEFGGVLEVVLVGDVGEGFDVVVDLGVEDFEVVGMDDGVKVFGWVVSFFDFYVLELGQSVGEGFIDGVVRVDGFVDMVVGKGNGGVGGISCCGCNDFFVVEKGRYFE